MACAAPAIDPACVDGECVDARMGGKADGVAAFDWSAPVAEEAPPLLAHIHREIDMSNPLQGLGEGRPAQYTSGQYGEGRALALGEDTDVECYFVRSRPGPLAVAGPFLMAAPLLLGLEPARPNASASQTVAFRFLDNAEGLDEMVCTKRGPDTTLTWNDVSNALFDQNDGAFAYFEELPEANDGEPAWLEGPVGAVEASNACLHMNSHLPTLAELTAIAPAFPEQVSCAWPDTAVDLDSAPYVAREAGAAVVGTTTREDRRCHAVCSAGITSVARWGEWRSTIEDVLAQPTMFSGRYVIPGAEVVLAAETKLFLEQGMTQVLTASRSARPRSWLNVQLEIQYTQDVAGTCAWLYVATNDARSAFEVQVGESGACTY